MIMEKKDWVQTIAYLARLETAKVIAQLNAQKARFCVLEKWIVKLAVMDQIFVIMVVSILAWCLPLCYGYSTYGISFINKLIAIDCHSTM